MKKRTLLSECYNVLLSADNCIGDKIKYLYVAKNANDDYKRVAVSQFVDIDTNKWFHSLNNLERYCLLETDKYTCIVRSESHEIQRSRIARSSISDTQRELNKLTIKCHRQEMDIQRLENQLFERDATITKLEKELNKFKTSMWDVVKNHFTKKPKVMSQREMDIYNVWLKTTGL